MTRVPRYPGDAKDRPGHANPSYVYVHLCDAQSGYTIVEWRRFDAVPARGDCVRIPLMNDAELAGVVEGIWWLATHAQSPAFPCVFLVDAQVKRRDVMLCLLCNGELSHPQWMYCAKCPPEPGITPDVTKTKAGSP